MKMKNSFETERLKLRVCTKHDAHLVLDFYHRNLEDFAQYEVIDRKNYGALKYHETLLNAEFQMFSDGRMVRYYIFEKQNPFVIIGTVAFHNIQYTHYMSATIGYKVDLNFRRQGIATEALQSAIAEMFQTVGLHRIEALVMPENLPSIALLEGIGFHREGLLEKKIKIEGLWHDHYLYAKCHSTK